jgi:hypothetical protein
MEEVPTITFSFLGPVELHCSATVSSPKLCLIPCDLQLFSGVSTNGMSTHTTRIQNISAPLSDAVIVLKYTLRSSITHYPFATIVYNFEPTNGPSGVVLSKLASRKQVTNSINTQSCILSMPFCARKKVDRDSLVRSKPNLSLSIPPAQYPNFAKAALTASLKTPLSGGGFCTPLDQRIQTPTVPPPLKIEASPYVLKNFVGSPTEPFSPSLEHTFTATSILNRLTMGALATGSPVITKEEQISLASPMTTRPPMARRRSSLCHTPGGYFRL